MYLATVYHKIAMNQRLQENYDLPSMLTTRINWRASETLSGVYKFELVRYIYIYICMYGGTYAIIVAHATYT